MTCHINKLVKQALRTFTSNQEAFSSQLEKLKVLLDKTVSADVGLANHELLTTSIWNRNYKAPATYIEIYENRHVTVGIFVLSPGMKLPLHNHPEMYGLIRVLSGKLKLTSFSVENQTSEYVIATRHEPLVVQKTTQCSMLDPVAKNLHEIESIDGPAAFLDILSPPYDTIIPEVGPRKCFYYEPIEQLSETRHRLRIINAPSWFWTDCYEYVGPTIRLDETVEAIDSSKTY